MNDLTTLRNVGMVVLVLVCIMIIMILVSNLIA